MNLPKFVLLVFALAGLLSMLPPTARAQESSSPDATNARLRALQQERVNVLKQAVELALAQYAEGMLNFGVVHATQMDLVEAQLEMAQTGEEQIKILTSQLKIAKGSLAIVEKRVRIGAASALDLHQAKSVALRIEIQLLKLQGAGRQPRPK
jgi:outer membrane protein TolC